MKSGQHFSHSPDSCKNQNVGKGAGHGKDCNPEAIYPVICCDLEYNSTTLKNDNTQLSAI